MFRFLSGLFSAATPDPDAPDKSLVEAAIERLVDGTDPRLRGFMNYRARLRDGVAGAVKHVIKLNDSLSEPVEISRRAYANDQRLRAFFASPDRMRETFQKSRALRDVVDSPGLGTNRVYALLAMAMDERQVLGMQLHGDQVQREVLQDVVNFSEHRIVCPSGSEVETDYQLKVSSFDFLVEQALKGILRKDEERVELEQQRMLLRRKLDAMQEGDWGLASMLADQAPHSSDRLALEGQIDAIEAKLTRESARPTDIEAHFDTINAVLAECESWLALRTTAIQVDSMLVKRQEASGKAVQPMELTEFHSKSGERRIVLMGYIPRDEIPPPEDGLDAAMRFLG